MACHTYTCFTPWASLVSRTSCFSPPPAAASPAPPWSVVGLAWNLVFSLIPVSLLANCAPSWTATLGSGFSSAAICCQPSSMMRNRGGAPPSARLQEDSSIH